MKGVFIIFLLRKREKLPYEIIKEELKNKFKQKNITKRLKPSDKLLLEHIRVQTNEQNLNNVTRTKSYLQFFLRHPEIHWALLAHMVSRNGGWNMTDLKGEFLTRLLSNREIKSFFDFLERGNWLIFQDAFPQLLLYEESLRSSKPLFYLLPHLGVSTFMETVWDYFWRYKKTYLLTIALIVNEQNYIEKRVVQHSVFKKQVFNKLEFKLQDLLSFNHILFPYGQKHLIGKTVHHFDSLHERILLGKRLYRVLIQDKTRMEEIREWAIKHPHTGSRKDYWPHIYNNTNEEVPGFPYQLRLQSCQLRHGANKIYSPSLQIAWKNVQNEEAEIGDWFNDWNIADYLMEENEMLDGEIKNEYCKTLEMLELASLAKKALFI
ncbi:DUF2515 family protein [Neobacillus terrae]|uniref:DUF2515 family protein n=1 Tax=Neobacillus terrae TaxID=3034837 RepID=UPI00308395A7